jgi:hypothetical protein
VAHIPWQRALSAHHVRRSFMLHCKKLQNVQLVFVLQACRHLLPPASQVAADSAHSASHRQ